ncbi:hypothetical protein DdX_10266 [Ditylenchus destructor]|uniref:Uncharacterized protein n=1 Tax=Ditylenchus destructor TaxID=166010 RepID=A0AAD4MYC6_9BILA|nr:hypothetical protein DdX_10266 [Ditylenchus destructor]
MNNLKSSASDGQNPQDASQVNPNKTYPRGILKSTIAETKSPLIQSQDNRDRQTLSSRQGRPLPNSAEPMQRELKLRKSTGGARNAQHKPLDSIQEGRSRLQFALPPVDHLSSDPHRTPGASKLQRRRTMSDLKRRFSATENAPIPMAVEDRDLSIQAQYNVQKRARNLSESPLSERQQQEALAYAKVAGKIGEERKAMSSQERLEEIYKNTSWANGKEGLVNKLLRKASALF